MLRSVHQLVTKFVCLSGQVAYSGFNTVKYSTGVRIGCPGHLRAQEMTMNHKISHLAKDLGCLSAVNSQIIA